MKKSYIFLAMFMASLTSFSLHAQFKKLWSQTSIRSQADNTLAVHLKTVSIYTDKDGNVYTTGNFDDNTVIGGKAIEPYALQDIYVTKTDKYGKLLWIKTQGGWRNDYAGNVITDKDGNVYTCGSFAAQAYIDSFGLTDTAGFIAITKYNSNGDVQWAKKVVVLDYGIYAKMLMDASGNIYLTTNYYNYAVADTTKFIDPKSMNQLALFCKFNSKLQLLWAKNLGKAGKYAMINDMDLDKDGNPFLCGLADGGAPFGTDSILGKPGYKFPYLAKYSSTGTLQWLKQTSYTLEFGQSYGHQIGALAVDKTSGDVYMVFPAVGNINVDSITVPFNTDTRSTPLLIKYSSLGKVKWARYEGKDSMSTGTSLVVDGGTLYMAGLFYDHYNLGLTRLFAGKPRGSRSFLSALDASSGKPQWAVAGDNIANLPVSYAVLGDNRANIALHSGKVIMAVNTSGESVSLTEMGIPNYFTGHIYRDYNENGIEDSTDNRVADAKIRISPDDNYFFTDENGDYQAYVDTGNKTITPALPWNGKSFSPENASHRFIGYSDKPHVQDFALKVNKLPDFGIEVSSLQSAIRSYGRALITIKCTNNGTSTGNGKIVMHYDKKYVYKQSTPKADSAFTSGDSMEWSFTDLKPLHSITIEVQFSSSRIVIDNKYAIYAKVACAIRDSIISNDEDSVILKGRESYDPNEKSVYPAESKIAMDTKKLTYTVRFQNTGNDTAFNVIVRDTLDKNLDPETFQMISSSHRCTYSIEKGELVCDFKDIMLPDSITNEPKSHGYFKYSLAPKKNLPAGTTINNTAGIYFDYNTPVITNTVSSTFTDNTSGIAEISRSTTAITLQPNPFSDFTTVRINKDAGCPCRYSLYDMQGKMLQERMNISNNEIRLERGPLKPGMYFLMMHNDKQEVIGKVKVMVE